jgi:hypothetical protein
MKRFIALLIAYFVLCACAYGQDSSRSPIYQQTAAELTAGVVPIRYYIPPATVGGYVLLERYGGAGDAVTDNGAAFKRACLVAGQTDAAIGLINGGNYLFTTGISLSGTGQPRAGRGPPTSKAGATCARIVGLGGHPVLQFKGLSDSTDCVTLGGGNLPQVELRDVEINCNRAGRDGVVILGSNAPRIENLVIENVERDSFVLEPSGYSWIEKLHVDGLYLIGSGRNAIRMQLSGSNNAYINEGSWRHVEIRGVSKVASGGSAVYMTSTATGGASKFADHTFIDPVWDSEYNGTGNLPSVSPFTIDSGTAQNFLVLNGGWESTGGVSPGTGYHQMITGGARWSGYTVIGAITNSYWGSNGVNPAVTQATNIDYSFNKTQLMGPTSIAVSSNNQTALSLSGQTTAGTQPDLRITRAGAASAVAGRNSSIELANGTSNSYAMMQEYEGNLILFSYSGGALAERARVLPQGGVQIGGLSAVYSCSGGPPSSSVGRDGDYAFRQDTPGIAKQRLYVKTSGSWVGIL